MTLSYNVITNMFADRLFFGTLYCSCAIYLLLHQVDLGVKRSEIERHIIAALQTDEDGEQIDEAKRQIQYFQRFCIDTVGEMLKEQSSGWGESAPIYLFIIFLVNKP